MTWLRLCWLRNYPSCIFWNSVSLYSSLLLSIVFISSWLSNLEGILFFSLTMVLPMICTLLLSFILTLPQLGTLPKTETDIYDTSLANSAFTFEAIRSVFSSSSWGSSSLGFMNTAFPFTTRIESLFFVSGSVISTSLSSSIKSSNSS